MFTFKQYLHEIKLSRLTGALAKGNPLGVVSPETEGIQGKAKRIAHKAMQSALKAKGDMVSWTGPHKGRYQYDAKAEPAKEGSYILKPGTNPEAKAKFHSHVMDLGDKFGQQSVLKVEPRGPEGAKGAVGAYHYMKSNKVEPKGKIHYNEPLKHGKGDTQMKKGSTFTVRQDTPAEADKARGERRQRQNKLRKQG